jgi:hypothetical protein
VRNIMIASPGKPRSTMSRIFITELSGSDPARGVDLRCCHLVAHQLPFETTLELGGVRPVLLRLREHDSAFPHHVPKGRTAGPPKTPCSTRVLRTSAIQRTPGAYVYGRRETVTRLRRRSAALLTTAQTPRRVWSAPPSAGRATTRVESEPNVGLHRHPTLVNAVGFGNYAGARLG